MFTLKHANAFGDFYIKTSGFRAVKWPDRGQGIRRVEFERDDGTDVRGVIDHGVVYVLSDKGDTVDTIRMLFGDGAGDHDGLHAPSHSAEPVAD